MIGQELTSHDEVRFVPDILQNGEELFFPVFTTAEEMGEYGDGFSKYQAHFLHAANLAKNNEKKVSGNLINAFSEPFVVPKEMFRYNRRYEFQRGGAGWRLKITAENIMR